MGLYKGNPTWREDVFQVEVDDPVVGGDVSWTGEYARSGYSNAAAQQLADRTVYLKEGLEALERSVDVGLITQDSASIEFAGEGVLGNPLRATLKESFDSIPWLRKDNIFTKDNFFRGSIEVEVPTSGKGAVPLSLLDERLSSKADTSSLAEVAMSGDYGDLKNKPASVSYLAGDGLTLSGTTFSLPVTISGSGSYVQSVEQNTEGLTITLGTPPDTTYSDMIVAEMMEGSDTTSRVMTAKNINDFAEFVALSGTSITPDLNSGRNFTFTPTANSTINNPTNARSGQTGDIVITSEAEAFTIGWGTAWKFANGDYPTTSPDSMTVVSYKVVDANTIICAWGGDIK